MPALKRKYAMDKYAAPRKRQRTVRRTYSGATSSKLPLSLDHTLLRAKQDATLRYHETISINPGVLGNPGYYAFRVNNLYDINYSGAGHQPRGYDQLMAMYKYIAVKEAQIEMWFSPTDGAPIVASLSADSKPDQLTDAPGRNEMFEAKTAVYGYTGGVSSDGPGYVTLRVKPWQLQGNKISDVDYKHMETTAPNVNTYINCRVAPLDTSDVGACKCIVRITLHVQLTEPKEPGAS